MAFQGTQRFMMYFSPFSQKWYLRSINTWTRTTRDICFQHRPNWKIHRIQIRQCRSPHLLTPKSLKMTFVPVLSFYLGVGRCSILLEGEKLTFEILFYLFKSWNLNIINVKVCLYLNTLFHKNQMWLPRFGDCSPHHEWKHILRTLCYSDCWQKLQVCKVFHQKKTISCSAGQPSNLEEQSLLYQLVFAFGQV